MLKYEGTNASVVQHEGEQSSEVAVNNATVFVKKCSKTEDIAINLSSSFPIRSEPVVMPYAGLG